MSPPIQSMLRQRTGRIESSRGGPVSIKDAILPEFDHEMGVTRKLLDRLPDGDMAWKPHDKSMSMGQLAPHVAGVPAGAGGGVEASEKTRPRAPGRGGARVATPNPTPWGGEARPPSGASPRRAPPRSM